MPVPTALLSQSYALMEEKDSALKEAERAMALWPTSQDWCPDLSSEENLGAIKTMVGDNKKVQYRL